MQRSAPTTKQVPQSNGASADHKAVTVQQEEIGPLDSVYYKAVPALRSGSGTSSTKQYPGFGCQVKQAVGVSRWWMKPVGLS